MGFGNAGSIKPPGGGTRDPGADVLTPSERDRILLALSECCAERGYTETTVEQVVERAGVERHSFDLLFADKEDCAIAGLNKFASEIMTTGATAGGAADNELERGLAGIRAMLDLVATKPASANLGYIAARQGGTERMRDTYAAGAHVIAVMMERTTGFAGSKSSPPPRAARAALGGAEALVRREIATGRVGNLTDLLPDFIYGAAVPFLGQDLALRLSRLAAERASDES